MMTCPDRTKASAMGSTENLQDSDARNFLMAKAWVIQAFPDSSQVS